MKTLKLLQSNLLYILLACILFAPNAEAQNKHIAGCYNIYIGKNVAKYTIEGSYNIIIVDSANYELQYIKDSYLFIVDYDCGFLKDNPEIKGYLKAIKRFAFVRGGYREMNDNRKEIWKAVSEIVLSAY